MQSLIKYLLIIAYVFIIICYPALSAASRITNTVTIAVASDFLPTLQLIADRFMDSHPAIKIILCSGASGTLYSQIMNGAPYDIFLSADTERPSLLEKNNLIVPQYRFTYAIGRLVLWGPNQQSFTAALSALKRGHFNHLAIANPDLSPYGLAAEQALKNLNIWQQLYASLVIAENINQTSNFLKSGNAEIGMIALSQLLQTKEKYLSNDIWIVPVNLYHPIQQQMVLLSHGKNNPDAFAFFNFLKTKLIIDLIKRYGYSTPVNKERRQF
jgi:molybdate transport system substrate-binding protein